MLSHQLRASAIRLLVVEDDRELRDSLAALLRESGYQVEAVANSEHAFELLTHRRCDLAIVDLMLPGMSGLALVRKIRPLRPNLAILILTARNTLEDRVLALDAGADDYLLKPFRMPELEARVRALLRGYCANAPAEIRIGPLMLVSGDPRISLNGTRVQLSPSELLLLEALAARVGQVVSKDGLAELLARGSEALSDTAIEMTVYRLRRRFTPFGLKIRTLRGFGYLLEDPNDRDLVV